MESATGVRAQNVRVVVFNETTHTALQGAVNTWLAASSERRLLSVQYETTSTGFSAMLTFTD